MPPHLHHYYANLIPGLDSSLRHPGKSAETIRVKLSIHLAFKTYRDGTLQFLDGTIIALLAYTQAASGEWNNFVRAAAERQGLPPEAMTKLLAGSSVAGLAMNVQFRSRTPTNMPRPRAGASLSSPMASQIARLSTEPA
jgi:hypothetical protein